MGFYLVSFWIGPLNVLAGVKRFVYISAADFGLANYLLQGYYEGKVLFSLLLVPDCHFFRCLCWMIYYCLYICLTFCTRCDKSAYTLKYLIWCLSWIMVLDILCLLSFLSHGKFSFSCLVWHRELQRQSYWPNFLMEVGFLIHLL